MKLYRFEPFEQIRMQTIIVRKLWLSMPKLFNDPFDTNPLISEPLFHPESDIDIFERKIRKHEHSKIWSLIKPPADPFTEIRGLKVPENWCASFEDNLRNIAMCCFCENWNNHQLWSYYAQSHKGICLEYECNFAELTVSRSDISFQRVNYASRYPAVNFHDLITSNNPEDIIIGLLYTKNINWSHENEWRFIMFNEKGGKKIGIPKGIELKGILAGCDMAKADFDSLNDICKQLKVSCEQLEKDRYRSRLIRPSESRDKEWWK